MPDAAAAAAAARPERRPSPSSPLRIGDLAKLLGTTPRTIRYYEEVGLLPGAGTRQSGAHRLYSEHDLERLREVMRLKELLGLTLDELKTLLAAEAARAEVRAELQREDVAPRRQRELLELSLGHIERQLELVGHRAAEIAKLREELADKRKRVQRRIRELDAHAHGSFPPGAPLGAGTESGR